MKYKQIIEDNFLIDEPKTGRLVPFVFNKVQNKYYRELCELGLEEKGVGACLREFIVKARREGFSSLILALFAADDIMQDNPTESQAISYKEDATGTFRRRYRRYVLCYFARRSGKTVEEIQNNPNVLEIYAKQVFSIDSDDLELRHNKAHFYCGTASARTGGRGGVLQKLLFSESAHYQDTERMTAKEIIEGTIRQVDISSGWVFQETTANGTGNYHYKTFKNIKAGQSRYKLRFYGWREFYTEDEMKVIASEFNDTDMLKQEYPETVEEAFLSSSLTFVTESELLKLVGCNGNKHIHSFLDMGGINYIDQAETILDWLVTIEKTTPNKEFFVGIDTAKSNDHTIVTVLEENGLSGSGGIQGLAIDSTGQGDFMPDWFEKNTGWYLHRVKFSRPSKSVLYKNLQSNIMAKRTTLPEYKLGEMDFMSAEWRRFHKQMIELQKEIIGSLLVISHPISNNKKEDEQGDYDNTPHDDYPDSWALAELLYTVIKGVKTGQKMPEQHGDYTSDSVRKLLNVNNRQQFSRSGRGSDDYA